MARKSHRPEPPTPVGRSGLVVLFCALFFAVLAMLPSILPALHLDNEPGPICRWGGGSNSSNGPAVLAAPPSPTIGARRLGNPYTFVSGALRCGEA